VIYGSEKSPIFLDHTIDSLIRYIEELSPSSVILPESRRLSEDFFRFHAPV
jgi:hypothetical protein